MKNHQGFNSHRLKDNPREVAFSKQWQEEQALGRVLHYILPAKPTVTERDEAVAATVVQWLGSNVGMSFLEQVIRSSPEIKNWLRQRALI